MALLRNYRENYERWQIKASTEVWPNNGASPLSIITYPIEGIRYLPLALYDKHIAPLVSAVLPVKKIHNNLSNSFLLTSSKPHDSK
jgi:hypothetical protein